MDISQVGMAIIVSARRTYIIEAGDLLRGCIVDLNENDKIELSLFIARIWKGTETGSDTFVVALRFIKSLGEF